MREYRFRLQGQTALLMHADDVAASDTLTEWRKNPRHKIVSKPGDDRSPAWTWMTYLYNDGNRVAIPVANMLACLRDAGKQIVLSRMRTLKAASQSGMTVAGESGDADYLAFRCGPSDKFVSLDALAAIRERTYDEQAAAVASMGFDLWAKRASLGKAKHVRVRPRFRSWSVTGLCVAYAPELTTEVVRQLFTIAGRGGLGDWRPSSRSPGPYGQFAATVEEV